MTDRLGVVGVDGVEGLEVVAGERRTCLQANQRVKREPLIFLRGAEESHGFNPWHEDGICVTAKYK